MADIPCRYPFASVEKMEAISTYCSHGTEGATEKQGAFHAFEFYSRQWTAYILRIIGCARLPDRQPWQSFSTSEVIEDHCLREHTV
ncbi:hypothetical protein GCM10007053_18480 [Halioglobus pacificus]|uniref:Uncharacterized protein n=1 Tax=Parahalioglobus pacificus TaxID=930806 RepID=A0A918XJJ1_9GAMM|nr:hypothetical protein GCM10007053_18480 [Halioglobus pacificus]